MHELWEEVFREYARHIKFYFLLSVLNRYSQWTKKKKTNTNKLYGKTSEKSKISATLDIMCITDYGYSRQSYPFSEKNSFCPNVIVSTSTKREKPSNLNSIKSICFLRCRLALNCPFCNGNRKKWITKNGVSTVESTFNLSLIVESTK